MTYRIASIIAFIAIVVAGWIALDRVQNGASASPPNTALTQDPGYAARDAQLIETGEDGLPMYTLRASLIQQQPATQVVTLDAVQMQMRDPDGDIWSGRADHGQILQDDSLVELNGGVPPVGTHHGGRTAGAGRDRAALRRYPHGCGDESGRRAPQLGPAGAQRHRARGKPQRSPPQAGVQCSWRRASLSSARRRHAARNDFRCDVRGGRGRQPAR